MKGTDKGGSVIPGKQVMISIQKTSGETLRQLHFWLSKAGFRSNQVVFCGMRSWLRCPVSKLCCEHINVSRNTVGVNQKEECSTPGHPTGSAEKHNCNCEFLGFAALKTKHEKRFSDNDRNKPFKMIHISMARRRARVACARAQTLLTKPSCSGPEFGTLQWALNTRGPTL